MWPYPGDVRYFRAMAVLGALCMLSVVAVEAYAIWFLFYAKENSDRDKYGILGEPAPFLLHSSCHSECYFSMWWLWRRTHLSSCCTLRKN
jgi:hypothetical protein